MKNFIIIALSLVLIGFMSANLQIQTNVENAVQTIKKIFITSDGLTNNGSNTLVTINSGNDGKVFIKNTLETNGSVILNGIPTNTGSHIITIGANNNLYKTDPSAFGNGGSNQWSETASTLSTNKIVGINNIGLNHQFWVGGTSIFQSGTNYIYIYPTNQFTSTNGGLASRNNNLKINTKSGGSLYLNYDVNADTIIKGKTAAGEVNTPTSVIDIQGRDGYAQLRLREPYVPSSGGDSNGEVGDMARGYGGGEYYIYLKTPQGRKRTILQSF